jgi:hypothetical protein
MQNNRKYQNILNHDQEAVTEKMDQLQMDQVLV